MNSFAERLTFLWNDAKPAAISKDLKMSISGIMRILEKDTMPKAETLILIKKLKNCDWHWLMTGEGEPFPASGSLKPVSVPELATDTIGNPVDLEEFVFVPQYEVLASAGHGYSVDDETPKYPVAFRRSWLQRHVPVDFAQLSIISVKGDSMEGVLNDRDTILVNHTLQSPADGVYVIRMGNDLFVKRTQVLPHNRLKVLSENPSYEPFEVDLSEPDLDFQVIGRVEAFFRKL